MKRFAYVALGVLVLSALASVAEAGIFRRRSGEPRRPVRNLVGHLFHGCQK